MKEKRQKESIKYYLGRQLERVDKKHLNGEAYEISEVQQATFCLIKGFDYSNMSKESLKERQEYLETLTNCIQCLTPKEFIQVIPIKKDFKGCKTETRDYFSTIEFIEAIGWDKKIPNGFEFLINYWADEVFMLSVWAMEVVSDFQQRQTGKSIMERFCEDQGIKLRTIDDFKRE